MVIIKLGTTLMKKKLAIALIPMFFASCVLNDMSGAKINTGSDKDVKASSGPVKLKDLPVTKVQIPAGSDLVISEGEKSPDMTASVTYTDNSIDGNVKWSSSDSTIATVNEVSGSVSGVKEGTVTIIAASMKDPNQRASIRITVRKAVIDALKTSITLGGKKVDALRLKTDETQTLQATIKLSNGTDSPNVTWTSSDSTVVNVRNGNLTALKYGVATITATAKEDSTKQAFVRVTVSDEPEVVAPVATPVPAPTVVPVTTTTTTTTTVGATPTPAASVAATTVPVK